VVLSTNYNLFHPLVLAMEEGCKNALKQAPALVNNNGHPRCTCSTRLCKKCSTSGEQYPHLIKDSPAKKLTL
jgi:hypothetical protein